MSVQRRSSAHHFSVAVSPCSPEAAVPASGAASEAAVGPGLSATDLLPCPARRFSGPVTSARPTAAGRGPHRGDWSPVPARSAQQADETSRMTSPRPTPHRVVASPAAAVSPRRRRMRRSARPSCRTVTSARRQPAQLSLVPGSTASNCRVGRRSRAGIQWPGLRSGHRKRLRRAARR